MVEEDFPLKDETHSIIGVCMEVHKILGKGFLEIVYKDAIEYELKAKKFLINVKRNILSVTRKSFFRMNFLQTLLYIIR